MRRVRALAVVPAALLAIALVAVGCTSPRHEGHRPSSSPVTTTKRTFKLAASGTTSVDVPSQPIATRPTSTPGMQFELYAVRRSDRVVDVVFALHDTSTQTVKGEKAFEGLSLSQCAAGAECVWQADNVSLVDPKGLRQYETFLDDPAKVGQSACLCSQTHGPSDTGEDDDFAAGSRRYYLSEVAAPPASVANATVLTGIASIPDVTITG